MRPTLEDVRGLQNFSQSFRWAVDLQSPGGLSGNDFNFRAVTGSVPNMNPTSTEIVIRGNTVTQPGIADWTRTIDMVLIETADFRVAEFIRQWREMCWSTDGGVTGRTRNKRELEGTLIMHLLDNQDNMMKTYVLKGVFPATVNYGELSDSAADPWKPTITFAFDYFTEE